MFRNFDIENYGGCFRDAGFWFLFLKNADFYFSRCLTKLYLNFKFHHPGGVLLTEVLTYFNCYFLLSPWVLLCGSINKKSLVKLGTVLYKFGDLSLQLLPFWDFPLNFQVSGTPEFYLLMPYTFKSLAIWLNPSYPIWHKILLSNTLI